MAHRWELHSRETAGSREDRLTHEAGLSGPLARFWSHGRKAPTVRTERFWECANCCMKVRAAVRVSGESAYEPNGRAKEGHPGLTALLSLPPGYNGDLNGLFPRSQLVFKRGKAAGRRYFNCEEFAVLAVHGT